MTKSRKKTCAPARARTGPCYRLRIGSAGGGKEIEVKTFGPQIVTFNDQTLSYRWCKVSCVRPHGSQLKEEASSWVSERS